MLYPVFMMLKFIPLTALVLGLSGGVALADRGHDHNRQSVEHRSNDHRGYGRGNTTVIRDHRGGWNRGNTVVVRDNHNWRGNGGWNRGWNRGDSRVVYRNNYRNNYRHVVRRPIYLSTRPVIHQRYYDYYRRPTLIVENYNTMPGYYWVAGSWTWGGSEWIWQPGHYEPDQSYVDDGYADDYAPGYNDSY